MEDFWVIVVTEGNADETENDGFERRRGADGAEYSALDAQAIFG